MRFLILVLLLCNVALADFNVEAGVGNLSSEWTSGAILFQERWDDWLVGIGYIGTQWVTPDDERAWWQKYRPNDPIPAHFVDRNLFIHGQRLLRWRKFEIGIGAAYFQNTNRALGAKFTVSSSASYHFNKNFSLNFRHFSNAGSATPNMGQDLLTIGWTF
jgi:hypothetical protein